MSLAIVYSRASSGIDAPLITVEVHLSKGMVGFSLVGLPETAVKESKERVRSAVLRMEGDFPGKRIFYALMLVPMMIVPAVAGYMFWMMFQSNGPINAVISAIIGQPFTLAWLSSEVPATIAVIIAEVWQWTPLMFLIMASGLVGLPEDQMRAATMLGASGWQKFRWLMLPMLKPIIIIALVIRGMEAVKIFDSIFLMTAGGPARATESLSIYMYKVAFQQVRWSFAAAAAMTVLVIMTIIASYALRPLQAPQRDAQQAAMRQATESGAAGSE